MTIALELIGVAALILLNAYFVAAEYSLVTVRHTRLHELAEAGSRRARLVLRIVHEPPRFISAMQLGVTGTSLGIGALGESALSRAFDHVMATVLAVIISFAVITFLHVVIGELVPKGIALGYAERVALAAAVPVRVFFFAFAPLIWFMQHSAEVVLRAMRLELPAESLVHSEAELKMLVGESTERGEIEHAEREMLYKVFDFADKEATDVMVPRPEVVALSAELSTEDALAAVIDSPYTRYPVYRGSLDTVIGVLHVRDLFSAVHENSPVQLGELLRPTHVVPETKDLAALLTEFRKTNQHMAVVVDEYGTTQGIVTLEDLLEEIVGDIEDEYDLPDESVERIDETTVRIEGTFPIDDFNEEFGQELDQDDFHTMAGFVFGHLGRAPAIGDRVEVPGLVLEVLEVEGTRIERLQVEFLPTSAPAPDGTAG
jgi:putative hemolysin